MNRSQAVMERYSAGAAAKQESLCCPVDYDAGLLALLPPEIVARDYGCGDPSRLVQAGDAVLDLGSGSGKVCYLAAQRAGAKGRVTGVDMNPDMLALARKYQREMAEKLGGDRVRFLRARIQDLATDLDAVEARLSRNPVSDADSLAAFEQWRARQRAEAPMIPDASIDLVISNCVLNLVEEEDRHQLLAEVFRVLKPGGRVAISDIVADESVPEALKDDPDLWSGCIAGAFQEQAFLEAFARAGFVAIAIDQWADAPWRTVAGIEFRPVTVTARKGEGRACLDCGHAVIYRGPYHSVTDDEDHVYFRGERMAVCERTFRLLTEGPYREHFIGIAPNGTREPTPWCAPSGTRRAAAHTKGAVHAAPREGNSACC